MKTSEWMKCTKQTPCRICGKPDWCTYTEDAACCMRIESPIRARNGGWIHRLNEKIPVPMADPQKKRTDPGIAAKHSAMLSTTMPGKIAKLAERLGVSPLALASLGCAYVCNHTYAFPMRDEHGAVIGIRYRSDTAKWAESGSRAGLFYQPGEIHGAVIVCEGPTDTAAAMSLGFRAVGRPSCRGQEQMLKNLISHNAGAEIVLCPDKDIPGMEGAQIFAEKAGRPLRMLVPPCKDLRTWLIAGATHDEVQQQIKNAGFIGLSNPYKSTRDSNSRGGHI